MGEERVLVKPASETVVETPPQFEHAEESVVDWPAQSAWQTGRALLESDDDRPREVHRLVEVPETRKTVTKRVLTRPASTREEFVPADYITVRRRVTKKPAITQTVTAPARCQTVKVVREVAPVAIDKVEEPERTQTLPVRKMIAKGRLAWNRVLCETDFSRADPSNAAPSRQGPWHHRRSSGPDDVAGYLGPPG